MLAVWTTVTTSTMNYVCVSIYVYTCFIIGVKMWFAEALGSPFFPAPIKRPTIWDHLWEYSTWRHSKIDHGLFLLCFGILQTKWLIKRSRNLRWSPYKSWTELWVKLSTYFLRWKKIKLETKEKVRLSESCWLFRNWHFNPTQEKTNITLVKGAKVHINLSYWD